MSLVVFTALVGLVVAPGHLHPVIGFTALLCIAIGAGAAGALNMWYDADIDAMMERTARRPVPAGRILPGEAFAFGITLAVGSVATLGLLVNWLAAGLLAFTVFFYVVVYTMWLKHATAAEHRDRRSGRRLSADDRLGRGHRQHGHRADPSVPDRIRVDAAALLGAGALSHRGLRAGRHPDAAGRRRGGRDAAPDPALHAGSGSGRAAPWLLGYAGLAYGLIALVAGAGMAVMAWRVRMERGPGGEQAPSTCSLTRSSTS